MNKVEKIKQDKDGLDVWDDVLRYAETGFSTIAEEDFVRMRWYGIYQQRPNEGHFMMRIKLPGGIVSVVQMREIAAITEQYARGFADVTTRQTFQWHWLTIADFPEIMARLLAVGIDAAGACGDIPRNVVSCPVSGLHKDELFDARPTTEAIHNATLRNKEFSNLPRKYKLSVSTDPEQCVQPEIHDFSLVGARDPKSGDLGFGLRVGGGLSTQPYFGQWVDAFFLPEQSVDAVRAVTAIFRDFGYRDKRTHARLKYLMADWGAAKFREKLVE